MPFFRGQQGKFLRRLKKRLSEKVLAKKVHTLQKSVKKNGVTSTRPTSIHWVLQHRKTIYALLLLSGILAIYPLSLKISQKWQLYALDLVKITGITTLHPYELLEELDLPKGTSLLTIDSLKIEQKLLAFPQIKEVSVKKIYPSTLKIALIEKEIAFLVKTPDEIYAISQFGEILYRGNRIESHDYFIIELSQSVKEESLRELTTLQAFLTDFARLPISEQTALREAFSGIYLGEEILIFAQNESVLVRLGPHLSPTKLRKAHYAYLYKQRHRLPHSEIDLRLDLVRYTTAS